MTETSPTDPKSALADWSDAAAYDRYMGRWSRQVAVAFLQWLGPARGSRWLDVGCGTGALVDAILTHCAPASVVGVDPSEALLGAARLRLAGQVTFVQAAGHQLPCSTDACDLAVAALMLNFAPEPDAVVAEMTRVTRPDGQVAAYVWDYGGTMELIRLYWQAARELVSIENHQDEGAALTLCRPDALRQVFERSALQDVSTTALDIQMAFADFDAFWEPFTGGVGPAPAHAMSLPPQTREALRLRLQARVPRRSDGSIVLQARAWAVRGRVKSA